jgi:hypothetical protein
VDVEMAVLDHRDLGEFIRLRPDSGLHIYGNLAAGLDEKLKRSAISPPSQYDQDSLRPEEADDEEAEKRQDQACRHRRETGGPEKSV